MTAGKKIKEDPNFPLGLQRWLMTELQGISLDRVENIFLLSFTRCFYFCLTLIHESAGGAHGQSAHEGRGGLVVDLEAPPLFSQPHPRRSAWPLL